MEIFKETEGDEEIINNASFIVCEVISKKNTTNDWDEFEAYFTSNDFLITISENIFRSEVLTNHLASVVNSLLQLFIQVI